ncbi:MAG: dipeptide ABC transporter ATP-binding protein [Hyphomicrobiales bacterium]|nr:dipeptide ABC transporter ATP-binding protein [Hyphomicrobiales bacterium]
MTADLARNVVEIDGLTLDFPTYRGRVHALSDVTLAVREGEIVGLVGESGCGKSVTSMSIIRLLPPGSTDVTSGTIQLLGRDVLGADEREMEGVRGKLVSMVFQEPMNALNPTIRIGRQITQVIHRHERVSAVEAEERAEALLTEMQVPDAQRIMRSYPFELSGGMRQRVLLAMAFSCNPAVLIADEPTTALDVTVQAQVLMLLKERAKQRGTSVLFITHDLAVVAQLCDSVYVMYAGHIVEEGPTRDVLRRPAHPYTRALLRSLPDLGSPREPLAAIAGTVPDLANLPTGCAFRPRCPAAHDACQRVPRLFAAPGDARHRAACWLLYEKTGSLESVPQVRADDAPAVGTPAGAPLLALDDIAVRFPVGFDWRGRARGHVHALNGIDLALRSGETVGIVGESGCGKTTLAQAVMRLLTPSRGRIVFDGIDLAELEPSRLREIRRRFQIVFQDPQSSLDPRMRVWRAIVEPLAILGKHSTSWLREKARALAEEVGLRSGQLDRYPHEFSGGQRQRIAIARALASDPDLLVLDEPTSALDVSVQAQILNLFLALQKRLGLAYLFISHNVAVVRHIADRVAVMYLGQIVELGTSAQVLDQPGHPYTRALLASVPKIGSNETLELPVRSMELPSNFHLPIGCFFRDRCPFAGPGCEKPQHLLKTERTADEPRMVRCHRVRALPPWLREDPER